MPSPQHRSEPPEPSRATVLVVDPEPLYRWFVTESLRASGVDVVTAGTVEDAVAYLRADRNLDLLVVDGQLHDDDQQLRHLVQERARVIPVLVLDSEDELSPDANGGAPVAHKPVDSAILVRMVNRELCRTIPA